MTREKTEKLGTLFLAVFSTGLAAQFATAGDMSAVQWLGATAAALGSPAEEEIVRGDIEQAMGEAILRRVDAVLRP